MPLLLLLVCAAGWWCANRGGAPAAAVAPTGTRSAAVADQPAATSSPAGNAAISTALRSWQSAHGARAATGPQPDAIAIAEGVRLATARRTAMVRLIREHPEQALREALTYGEWDSLPPAIRALVETPFSTVADYAFYPVCRAGSGSPPDAPAYVAELAMPDGGKLEAFVFGSRLDLMSKRRLPVQGIALDGVAALRQEPLQEVAPADLPAARGRFDAAQADSGKSFATGEPVGPAAVHAVAGGRILVFDNPAELAAANQRLAAAEARPGPVAATAYLLPDGDGPIDWDNLESFADEQASAWTETKKKVFLIRVNFTDNPAEPVTQAAASAVMNGTVSNDIRAMSYNRTWIEATVSANLYQMPLTAATYANGGSGLNTELLRDARNTFRTNKSGADAAINLGPVSNTGSGDGGGLGDFDIVGVTFSSIGMVSGGIHYAGLAGGGNLWMQGTNSPGVYTHEFGHNYGIGHASSWDTTDGSVVGTGASTEYGDVFDIMGDGPDPEGHFHAQAKLKLNWLTAAEWTDATAAGSNTYRIHRVDNAATTAGTTRGVRVTKVAMAGSQEYYWLGYRPAFAGNGFLQRGLYLNWQRAGATRCWLLDTTPGTAAGKDDAAVTLGRTFSDAAANVHLTPLATGGSGADRYLDVRVNLGPFPGNAAPVAAPLAGPATLPARTTATFTGSATDANGDSLAYHWDTKDGLVNDNTAGITHGWTTGGIYPLDLTISDMKGGVATVSRNVTVTDPLDTWTQQSSGSTGYLRAAVWGKGRFVVADLWGAILTSWDGVTWTGVGDAPGFDRDPRLAFGNGMFVIVGKRDGAAATQIGYSPDGRTWREAAFPAGVPQVRDLAFANHQFVAVGDAGTVLTSADGITWALTTVAGAPAFRYTTHDGGVWLAVATNSSSGKDETVWTSATGTSWSQHGELGMDASSVASRAGVLYATGWYGGVRYSTDHGLIWSEAQTPDTTRWSTGRIAVADDGTMVVTAKAMDESGTPQALLVSTDGTRWARSAAATGFAYQSNALVFGCGRFLTTEDGGVIRTSGSFYPDNTAPSASLALAPDTAPARQARLFAVSATDAQGDPLTYAWDFGLPGLIADDASVVKSFDFGGSYTATCRVSDGKGGLTTLTRSITVSDPARTFVQRVSGTTNTLHAIATNGSVAVAVGGSGGVIRTSPDGITWTTRTVTDYAANLTFRGAAWDGSKFIIVGQDYRWETVNGWVGVIYTSPDGTTWTRRHLGGTAGTELQAVASQGTGAVAVGSSGTILQSADGQAWSPVTVDGLSSTTLKGVAFGGGTYVLTGYSSAGSGTGKVFTSGNRVNWLEVTAGGGFDASWQDLRRIAWLNDRFVASGWYSKLRVSTDSGVSFTTTRTANEETPALAYGDGIYFTAGINRSASNADTDLLSLDGVTWTASAAPTTDDRNGAVFFKHTFITVGAAGTIWQSADLTPAPPGGNSPPVFPGYAMTTPYQTDATLPVATLLTAASDPDLDVILPTAAGPASAHGGTVLLGGGVIRYTPPAGFSGADSFPVTLTDARGATVAGTVTVTVQPAPAGETPPVAITLLPGGGVKLDFAGLPGQPYEIQRSADLVHWDILTTVTASATGAVTFTDPAPLPGRAFYRLLQP